MSAVTACSSSRNATAGDGAASSRQLLQVLQVRLTE
jgi:hypothetical protein